MESHLNWRSMQNVQKKWTFAKASNYCEIEIIEIDSISESFFVFYRELIDRK